MAYKSKIKYSEYNFSGVAGIVNTINNKQYIIFSRCIQHYLQHMFYKLRNNKFDNKEFQEDFNKYGIDSFIIKIYTKLFNFTSVKEINLKIQIDTNNLYNKIVKNTYINNTYHKQLKDAAYKSKIERCHKVAKFDLNGNFIKCYNSYKEAALENNIHHSNIYRACNGEIKTAKNYQWRFVDKDDNIIPCKYNNN